MGYIFSLVLLVPLDILEAPLQVPAYQRYGNCDGCHLSYAFFQLWLMEVRPSPIVTWLWEPQCEANLWLHNLLLASCVLQCMNRITWNNRILDSFIHFVAFWSQSS